MFFLSLLPNKIVHILKLILHLPAYCIVHRTYCNYNVLKQEILNFNSCVLGVLGVLGV
jgi:hypothetical protein